MLWLVQQLGSDGVVVEMVRALSWPNLLWLYLLFLVRFGGWETERPDALREVVLTAIPKKSDKAGFRAMRYISLLSVLQKFYIRALQSAVRRERKTHKTHILGYEPGRSIAGVIATMVCGGPLWPQLMWRVPLTVPDMMMLKRLCCKKVFILRQSALFCANLVTSKAESICLALRFHMIFCTLVVRVRKCGRTRHVEPGAE